MNAHMPFLYDDGVVFAAGDAPPDGGPVRWKLHFGSATESARPLATGLPDHVVECSPSLAADPGGVELYFVGQDGERLRFYVMRGHSVERLSRAVPMEILGRDGAHAGTRGPSFAALDRPEAAGLEVSAFGALPSILSYARLALDGVARVTFEYARPWRMLASGPCGDEWHTTLYDFKTDVAFRVVLADGSGVYKASIHRDRLAYAARLSEAFEAREIRHADDGGWRLEPLPAPAAAPLTRTFAAPATAMTATAFEPTFADEVKARRERTLRANCAVGSHCVVCRNHADTRFDLEALGLVDRDGRGCPRGLGWNVPEVALAAIRPFAPGGGVAAVWCERFMVGTTPARCLECVNVRAGGDADAAARWLQGLADCRTAFACADRIKTDRRELQTCCGRSAKEVAVYACGRFGRDVTPDDCAGCVGRTASDAAPAPEAVPC